MCYATFISIKFVISAYVYMHVHYSLQTVSSVSLNTILNKELQSSWQSLGPIFKALKLVYVLASTDFPYFIKLQQTELGSSIVRSDQECSGFEFTTENPFCIEKQNSILQPEKPWRDKIK